MYIDRTTENRNSPPQRGGALLEIFVSGDHPTTFDIISLSHVVYNMRELSRPKI